MKKPSEEMQGIESIKELSMLLSRVAHEKVKVPNKVLQLTQELHSKLSTAVNAKPEKNLREVVHAFIETEFESESTSRCYLLAFNRFYSWCEERKISIATASYQDISSYMDELKAHYNFSTVRQHVAALRTIMDWLMVNGYMSGNPIPQLREKEENVSRVPQTEPLTLREVHKLFSSFRLARPIELRDRAMVGSMLYAFIPLNSLIELRVKDYISVKGEKFLRIFIEGEEQLIPLHSNAAAFIDEYLLTENILSKPDHYLFPAYDKHRKITGNKMDRRTARDTFNVRGKRAKIEKVNPMRIRTTGLVAFMQSRGYSAETEQFLNYRHTRTQLLYKLKADQTPSDLHELFDDFSEASEALQKFIQKTGLFQLEEQDEEQ